MLAGADDLRRRVQAGRDARLDWLAEHAPAEAIATTLTALANAQGGTLLIGMDEQGVPAGVSQPADVIDRVMQASLMIEPRLVIPMPATLHVDAFTLVAVQVPPGMPHVYAHDGRYWARHNAGNIVLNPRELRRLTYERGDVSFELEPVYAATLDDFDWDKVRSYMQSLQMADTPAETVLLRRGCIVRHAGQLLPTYAGILLFGRLPQQFVRGAEITAVRFAGQAMGDTFKREDIGGTLPDQLQRAHAFLIDHLRKGVNLGRTMARTEQFEYPMEAARELVVNAIAHRDYSIDGDGVRLFIFRDRMEVTSPGRLPGPVTVSNIKEERFSRNPVIVQVLSDMGFIERLGYGVDRVMHLMREQALREPDFTETAGGFRVVLYNAGDVGETPIPVVAPVADSLLSGHYRGVTLNSRQEVAIHYLLNEHNRITNSDLQMLCKDVHPETIRRDLAALVTKGVLRKMGEKRGSYYVLDDDVPAP